MAVDTIARMMALDAAQQGGTVDAYTKAETDELLSKKPGEITTGKQYTIDGQTVTAAVGAETFNDLANNKAADAYSHAEGNYTTASGPVSHAEGNGTVAAGVISHAEGQNTIASGQSSHAEGAGTKASGKSSHAEGNITTASGAKSHAEGSNTTASGPCSHTEGQGTKASSQHQHVQGKYNVEDSNSKYAFIIGNGTADNARHNAFAIDWNGLIYVNGAATGVNVATLAADLAALTARVEAIENQ